MRLLKNWGHKLTGRRLYSAACCTWISKSLAPSSATGKYNRFSILNYTLFVYKREDISGMYSRHSCLFPCLFLAGNVRFTSRNIVNDSRSHHHHHHHHPSFCWRLSLLMPDVKSSCGLSRTHESSFVGDSH